MASKQNLLHALILLKASEQVHDLREELRTLKQEMDDVTDVAEFVDSSADFAKRLDFISANIHGISISFNKMNPSGNFKDTGREIGFAALYYEYHQCKSMFSKMLNESKQEIAERTDRNSCGDEFYDNDDSDYEEDPFTRKYDD